jgi:cobalamin biosynthesis Co2+ chelatase CbiK
MTKPKKYACCPHCELVTHIDEKTGAYTYGCKNLKCKCHKLDKIYDKAYEEGRLDVLNHLMQIADECEYEELRREVQAYADIHDIQIGEPVTYKN